MEYLRIALDWTANTNHTGFFVAKEKGYYKEVGLDVELLTPNIDDYTITPAKKVELGKADFALCPFESIISYRTKKNSFDAVAIAAIFREDLSAIVTLGEGRLKRPKDLDGAVYASYQARYEDEIVRQMIKNDGGKGDFEVVYPKKLGIWETILNEKFDATWVFMNWEGIQAKNKGVSLHEFKMEDFGIPYGYSPAILTSESTLEQNKESYSNFLKATKKGYLFAQENTRAAVACIAPFVSEQDKDIDLMQSQVFTSPYYGTSDNWGTIDMDKVKTYVNWLYENGLESVKLDFRTLVYGELF